MAQVPEKVLSWLYSSLHEYYDARRTYADTAKVLATYHPSISPRTETYTYENGAPALLLTLTGTIPVAFRGATYRCPVKLWIPHNYPHEPPMTYVNPGKEMVIRPGQHVGIDGRVYHPYLRDWSRIWDRSSICDFLGILQQVFAKEPPVISKAQQQQYQRPIGQSQQPAPPPQLPPKQRHGAEPIEMPSINTPPPRPPKPGESANEPSRDISRDGPPLPPLPPEATQNRRTSGIAQAPGTRAPPQAYQSPPPDYYNGRPPGPRAVPPPLSPQHLLQPQPRPSNADRSPVSPLSPANGYSEAREERNLQYPPYRQNQPQPLYNNAAPQAGPHQNFAQVPVQHQLPRQYQPAPQQIPQPKKQPPPDLLSDPFDVALPSLAPAGPPHPAPPIPPNPEKEHLLQAISSTLVQQARQRVNQNMAAIQPLQAQQNALQAAHGRLEAEIRQLEQLDSALSSNEAILRRSIQDCDRTISTAKSKKQPPIDEVLIAPTMVANQLWTLCAEEAACREAMYVLQKAVDRGRVSGNDFVRQMRGLGRECFLKMALARKCAKGMGLDAPPPR